MTILKCKKSWAWNNDPTTIYKLIEGQKYIINKQNDLGIYLIIGYSDYNTLPIEIIVYNNEIDEYLYSIPKLPNNIQVL
jgi:hypothetical protein